MSQFLPVMEAIAGFHYFYYKKIFASCFYMGLVSFSNVYLNEAIITKTLAKTFPVAVVTKTGLPDSVTGKFET